MQNYALLNELRVARDALYEKMCVFTETYRLLTAARKAEHVVDIEKHRWPQDQIDHVLLSSSTATSPQVGNTPSPSL